MNRLQKARREDGNATLLGIAVYFYDPIFLEMAARLGFRVIWIEMEHGFISFAQAADLCRMARGTGLLTMIRVADTRRENVMKAAECGPDIIDVPMIETPEMVNDLIQGVRFPPAGNRGFFSVSRALEYGLVDSIAEEQMRLNDELCLMVQIETQSAVNRIDELCAIPGVEIFIGPSDLSASLGVPGQLGHSRVFEAARRIIACAKQNQKLVAVGAGPAEFGFYADQGVDLLFCGNDIACMRLGIQSMIEQARAALRSALGK
ncbi:MAG TPA: aldolase/citrate lyase family protein [Terracidiphilus sp.]|jgi:2-keto-3-deoxy-L-rhamnonate aldolase RhmA